VPDKRICPVGTSRPYAFVRARSYARYQEALVRAIVTLKFERREPLAKWFANRLAELMQAALVVPVPLDARRLGERRLTKPSCLEWLWLFGLAGVMVPPADSHPPSSRQARPQVRASVGNLSVALLPHARAPKLTIYASYW